MYGRELGITVSGVGSQQGGLVVGSSSLPYNRHLIGTVLDYNTFRKGPQMSVKRLEPDSRGITGSYSPGTVSFADFQEPWALVDYAAENDFELIIYLDPLDYESGGVVTLANLDAVVNLDIEHCQDAHVNYWINIEYPIYWGNMQTPAAPMPITISSVSSDYDTYMGPLCNLLEEDESPYFQGYQFEGVWDNGLQWLRARSRFVERSDLKLYGIWNGDWPYPGNPADTNTMYGTTPHNADFRLQLLDEVSFNLYDVYWSTSAYPTLPHAVDNCIGLLNYEPAGYTKPPIGVQVGLGVLPDSGAGTLWGYTFHDTTTWPIADQMKRAAYYLNYIKANARPFDNVNYWLSGYYIVPPTPTWRDIISFFESLNLRGSATRGNESMSQKGITPYYTGASTCNHVTPIATDTFTNTGNEVILLKSWSGTSTHTITVTGTVPNGLTTTQSYTRTLSPNQGTPIGPFPVDQFGSLATITYDNTNLYVAIIGAWRTGFEPL